MRFLVFDDLPQNRASAELTLHDQNLIICKDIIDVRHALDEHFTGKPIDGVLTDVYVPTWALTLEAMDVNYELEPENSTQFAAGLVVALMSRDFEIRTIVCSDGNRHNSWVDTTIDVLLTPDKVLESKHLRKKMKMIDYFDTRSVPLRGHWWSEDDQELLQFSDDQIDILTRLYSMNTMGASKYINGQFNIKDLDECSPPLIKDWRSCLEFSEIFTEFKKSEV